MMASPSTATSSSPCTATTTTVETATISAVHPDVLQTHILTRLDGPTLASTSCVSTELNALASQQNLWFNICSSTWPSTTSPRVSHIISSFPPRGPRSFFSSSFPSIHPSGYSASSVSNNTTPLPSELISAVDIYYRDEIVFSRVVETETESSWFKCSPFRIDMLDPKDTCQSVIPQPINDEDHLALAAELKLSWIIIDPERKRAMNLSSYETVSVQKHWLSGEIHARFGLVVGGAASEFVQCGILVTCGGGSPGRGGGGGMHVREVSLQMEDMDGMFLTGRDSLGILRSSFEGKKGIRGRTGEEGKRMYERFLETQRERKERKLRKESTLDILCVAFGVLVFSSLGLLLFLR